MSDVTKSEEIDNEMLKDFSKEGIPASPENCLIYLYELREVWADEKVEKDQALEKILYEAALSSLIFKYQLKIMFPKLMN